MRNSTHLFVLLVRFTSPRFTSPRFKSPRFTSPVQSSPRNTVCLSLRRSRNEKKLQRSRQAHYLGASLPDSFPPASVLSVKNLQCLPEKLIVTEVPVINYDSLTRCVAASVSVDSQKYLNYFLPA